MKKSKQLWFNVLCDDCLAKLLKHVEAGRMPKRLYELAAQEHFRREQEKRIGGTAAESCENLSVDVLAAYAKDKTRGSLQAAAVDELVKRYKEVLKVLDQ